MSCLSSLTNIFFVDLPGPRGRHDILTKLTKNGTKPRLSEDVDLRRLAESNRCEGFSGADLANLVGRAAQFKLEEICGGAAGGEGDKEVLMKCFGRVLVVGGARVPPRAGL